MKVSNNRLTRYLPQLQTFFFFSSGNKLSFIEEKVFTSKNKASTAGGGSSIQITILEIEFVNLAN